MRIHERASPASLGLLRVIVFAPWAVIPIWEWVPGLAHLPVELFNGPGPLALLPDSAVTLLLSSPALWTLTLLMVVGSTLVATGLVPHRGLAAAVALLILWEQGIVRGYSGHINHAELVLAYMALAISVFPIFDGLSARRPTRTTHPVVMYRAPFVVAMLIFTLSFSFVGAARISEGIDLFASDTLRNLLAGRWLQNNVDLTDGKLPTSMPAYLEPSLATGVQLSYIATTLAELLSPFALATRVTRLAFVAFAIVFHTINLLVMGVPFYENMLLLAVFSEIWFHRFAYALQAPRAASVHPPVGA